MSEIEKLYINANVEKEWRPLPYGGIDEFYPLFTAEKQLKLLLFQINKGFKLEFEKKGKVKKIPIEALSDAIAGLINNLWQDLTETDKVEIRRILE